MKHDLIAFTGAIGSGKSFAARALMDECGYQEIAWADPLKRCVAEIWGLPYVLLKGDTEPSREWREEVNPGLTREFGRDMTPRMLLQEFGTEGCRSWHPSIWVEATRRNIERAWCQGKPVVLPDTRYINEAALVHRLGGRVVRIERAGAPAADSKVLAHQSEGGIPAHHVDLTIPNDGTRAFHWAVAALGRAG